MTKDTITTAFTIAIANRLKHDREWAEFMELLAQAAKNPTPENVQAALDAEFALTGDCEAVGLIAEAVGYDEESPIHKPITDLDLSVRATNILLAMGLTHVRDIVRLTEKELLEKEKPGKNWGLGRKTVKAIKETIESLGFSLGSRFCNLCRVRFESVEGTFLIQAPGGTQLEICKTCALAFDKWIGTRRGAGSKP